MIDPRTELPAPGQSAARLIAGPVGALEAQLAMPAGAVRGVGLICHPHPLFGGSMTNKVVSTLATAAVRCGLLSLRFNFRGVGRSEGRHDQGRGETEDVLALCTWLRAQAPDVPLLLAGFSFGGWIALRAARPAQAMALITIAPPLNRYVDEDGRPPHPQCPWLIVHSRDDDTVPFTATQDALAAYDPAPRTVALEDAGHFFHGRLNEVRDAATGFLSAHWPK